MKFLFPLPLVFDGNESRFLQRDGARLAEECIRRGHEGVKLIINGGDGHPEPSSPILKTAAWKDWINPEYWRREKADLILLYGGMAPRLEPVARAIRESGETTLVLKMDSAFGLTDFYQYFWTDIVKMYHVCRQHHGVPRSILTAALRKTKNTVFPNKSFQRRYLRLFHYVTSETDQSLANTRRYCRKHGMEDMVEKIVELSHPIPDAFCYSLESAPKKKQILAVAVDWKNPLKGGKLLSETLAKFLPANPEYTAKIVGGASDDIRKDIASCCSDAGARTDSLPLMESKDLVLTYTEANIFILSSGSEGCPIASCEAACCGCSVVYSPAIRQLDMFSKSNAGTMARRRTPKEMCAALDTEARMWESGMRDPIKISSQWTGKTHVSRCVDFLIDMAKTK